MSFKTAANSAAVSEKAAGAVTRFVDTLTPFSRDLFASSEIAKKKSSPPLADLVTQLIAKVDYRSEIDRQYDQEEDRESRWQAVEEVVNALSQYETESSPPDAQGLSRRDHARRPGYGHRQRRQAVRRDRADDDARGQGAGVSACLYGRHGGRSVAASSQCGGRRIEAIEEERRLCYVGVTRAMELLTLSLSLTRMKWGKPRDTDPSRFLFEITGQADKPQDIPPPKSKAGAAKAKTQPRQRAGK